MALHIHYVGLEFGIGRYQPHPADDVLSNEYGDCKDKHTLLATLLKAAGIEAWPVLISSSRELDPATPSPAQFDHVITLVPLDGKLLWMDSTAEVAPVGVLMASLRDKQALAIPDGKPAYLKALLPMLPSPRSLRLHVEGKLSDQGLFTGHIARLQMEILEPLFASAFARFRSPSGRSWCRTLRRLEGYAGEVSNPQVSEVEQIAEPFQFSFDYTREKYYQWNDKDYFALDFTAAAGDGRRAGSRREGEEACRRAGLGSRGETVYHAVLELPKGWTMTYPKISI